MRQEQPSSQGRGKITAYLAGKAHLEQQPQTLALKSKNSTNEGRRSTQRPQGATLLQVPKLWRSDNRTSASSNTSLCSPRQLGPLSPSCWSATQLH